MTIKLSEKFHLNVALSRSVVPFVRIFPARLQGSFRRSHELCGRLKLTRWRIWMLTNGIIQIARVVAVFRVTCCKKKESSVLFRRKKNFFQTQEQPVKFSENVQLLLNLKHIHFQLFKRPPGSQSFRYL